MAYEIVHSLLIIAGLGTGAFAGYLIGYLESIVKINRILKDQYIRTLDDHQYRVYQDNLDERRKAIEW